MPTTLSVVIPAHNVEDYIEGTISSLLAQDDEGLDVVVVDDGSTDETADRARALLSGASRMRWTVIQQENKGVSEARNAGLEAACGEYVLFLDGDDFVSADLLTSLRHATSRRAADVIAWRWDNITPEPGAASSTRVDPTGRITVLPGRSALRKLTIDRTLKINMISAAYRREFLRDHRLSFTTDCRKGQDREFIYKSVVHAEDVVLNDTVLSHYVARQGSTTHSYKIRHFDSVVAHRRVYDYVLAQGRDDLVPVAERILFDFAVDRYLGVVSLALRDPGVDIQELRSDVERAYPGLDSEMRALILRGALRSRRPRWGRMLYLVSPTAYAHGVRRRHRREAPSTRVPREGS
jgi:glycosyltransferase involved in cell wall biosynthesis